MTFESCLLNFFLETAHLMIYSLLRHSCVFVQCCKFEKVSVCAMKKMSKYIDLSGCMQRWLMT